MKKSLRITKQSQLSEVALWQWVAALFRGESRAGCGAARGEEQRRRLPQAGRIPQFIRTHAFGRGAAKSGKSVIAGAKEIAASCEANRVAEVAVCPDATMKAAEKLYPRLQCGSTVSLGAVLDAADLDDIVGG